MTFFKITLQDVKYKFQSWKQWGVVRIKADMFHYADTKTKQVCNTEKMGNEVLVFSPRYQTLIELVKKNS